MTTVAALTSFSLMVALLTVLPGLDTALILRTATLGTRRRAWGVTAGIQCGTLAWGGLTAAGVTAIFTASHLAYEVVRWAGALYLIWMGVGMLRASFRDGSAPAAAEPQDDPLDFWPGWRRGLTTNLLNPKMGAFYLAVLPQFIPAGAPVLAFGLLLAGIHVVLGTLWSGLLILLATRLRDVLRRDRVRRTLDRVTGGLIAAFGVRLATTSSH